MCQSPTLWESESRFAVARIIIDYYWLIYSLFHAITYSNSFVVLARVEFDFDKAWKIELFWICMK